MQEQRRFAGPPLELAAVLVAVAQIAAQAALQQLARQLEGGSVVDIALARRSDNATRHGRTGDRVDDQESPCRLVVGKRVDGNGTPQGDRSDGNVVDATCL